MTGIRNDEGYLDLTPYEAMKNIEKERKKNMSNYDIKRGDIFYVYKFPDQVGSEQSAGRPAIIVSNDLCNKNSDAVEIVFCTTQPKPDLPTHVRILSTRKDSTALCEQITSVDKSRIGDFIGSCNTQEMEAIDVALLISVGLNFDKPKKNDTPPAPAVQTNNVVNATPSAELMKMEAQRDTYKQMYEDLLQRLMAK